MEKKQKKHYPGLSTRRVAVVCEPLMASSQVKLKVKTAKATTEATTDEWWEEDGGTLVTSITTTLE